MTKLCICQICTCGRHKCPHYPRGTANLNQPCEFSEYATKYHAHPIEMRKNFKPDYKPTAGDGPMEDRTTHRVDFIPHPLEKPFVHQSDVYQRPEGDMDMMTNYHKEFTKKPMEQVKAIRHDETRKLQGKFEGEPTYTADYRKWGVQPREKITLDAGYRPPSAPFQGSTNYQNDYIKHRGAQRQSMRPNEAALASDQPFDDATDYKQSYIKHPLPMKEVREKTIWQPNLAPMDDLSNYRKDYTLKGAGKQDSCKPDATPYQSQAPFEDATTQKVDYVPWPTEKPYAREHEIYKKPDGDMNMQTTTGTDFVRKPMDRAAPMRPMDARKTPGKFDGTTNYQMEYRKWAMDRPQAAERERYMPNEAPFEGKPTYQSDYIQHRAAMTKSMKPVDLGYASGAPLEDGTEYKKEFTKKWVDPCPVPAVEAGVDNRYAYKEQDEVGHKWYDYMAARSNSAARMTMMVK